MRLLLYKTGQSFVAEFTRINTGYGDISFGGDLVNLSFVHGEIDVRALDAEVRDRDDIILSHPTATPGLLENSPQIILATLSRLGFEFDLPLSWIKEINTPYRGVLSDDRMN